jgi:hypothetical protein
MKHGVKNLFTIVGLFFLSSICFAQISLEPWPAPGVTQVDYYAEYSFAEAEEGAIDSDEIHGRNGWKYHFVGHWTRSDIQNRINSDSQGAGYRRTASEYMSRMLRASADKRIFVIDTSVGTGPYGWLFIKINENEYILFFTGT